MDIYGWLKNQSDRTAAVVATVGGSAALLMGWLGVSRSSLATEQIPYVISGAVGGLFALGIAATLWLSADLRDEWRKLDDIYKYLQTTGDRERIVEQVAGRAPRDVGGSSGEVSSKTGPETQFTGSDSEGVRWR